MKMQKNDVTVTHKNVFSLPCKTLIEVEVFLVIFAAALKKYKHAAGHSTELTSDSKYQQIVLGIT